MFNWYAIEKDEMLRKDFRGIEKLIKTFEKVGGTNARQSITMTFSGYDDVPDEIFEIMEIRQYVKVLIHKYPHIFYYLNVETECLQNILLCYCDVEYTVIGERKAISQYSMEEIVNGELPQRPVFMNIENRILMNWKKELRKYGIKMNDLIGANKVIKDIEKIFA